MGNNEKQLGLRIKEIRERLGLTQEKLASILNISRPAVTQIEQGTRRVCAEELQTLATAFNISIDRLLKLEKDPIVEFDIDSIQPNPEIRISVPQNNLQKFRETILYILWKIGSRPNIGETVLYKLLYFIDFNYFEKYEEQLIGAAYQKNHYGPTPIEFGKIVEQMMADRELEKVKSEYFQYPQTKYLPLRQPDLTIFRASEIQVIDEVLSRLGGMNAHQISDYSHQDVPWLTTEDGKIIPYEAVFYRTPSYSVRDYQDETE